MERENESCVYKKNYCFYYYYLFLFIYTVISCRFIKFTSVIVKKGICYQIKVAPGATIKKDLFSFTFSKSQIVISFKTNFIVRIWILSYPSFFYQFLVMFLIKVSFGFSIIILLFLNWIFGKKEFLQ